MAQRGLEDEDDGVASSRTVLWRDRKIMDSRDQVVCGDGVPWRENSGRVHACYE